MMVCKTFYCSSTTWAASVVCVAANENVNEKEVVNYVPISGTIESNPKAYKIYNNVPLTETLFTIHYSLSKVAPRTN